MAFGKKKHDFLDGVVEEMGPDNSDDEYGAKMMSKGAQDAEDEMDGGADDPEEKANDQAMAAKMVGKALGLTDFDASALAKALSAFVKAAS